MTTKCLDYLSFKYTPYTHIILKFVENSPNLSHNIYMCYYLIMHFFFIVILGTFYLSSTPFIIPRDTMRCCVRNKNTSRL